MHNFLRSCKRVIFAGLFILLATACSTGGINTSSNSLQGPFSVPAKYIYLLKPSEKLMIRDQNVLTKLLMLLESQVRTNEEKAQIFYEIALAYDDVGLDAMARFMLMNSIANKPDYALPYELLGIYFLKEWKIPEACDAFDSAIELDTTKRSMFAYLNRAYAMYYTKRYAKAYEDIMVFYNADKSDPYRLLSKFIIESKFKSKSAALQSLREELDLALIDIKKGPFAMVLINFELGKFSQDDLFEFILNDKDEIDLMREHLCEAYYYLGIKAQDEGNDKLAYDYFKLTRATDKYNFLEYRNAYLEIKNLLKKYNLATSVNNEDGDL